MKYLITVLSTAALLNGCVTNNAKFEAPKIVVDGDQLEQRDDLHYFEDKPFTGVTVEKYEKGQKWREVTYKDGKMDGLGTSWWPNGQKLNEGNRKDGKRDGLWTTWYGDGEKWAEATFKDGKVISSKRWEKDGNLKY